MQIKLHSEYEHRLFCINKDEAYYRTKQMPNVYLVIGHPEGNSIDKCYRRL